MRVREVVAVRAGGRAGRVAEDRDSLRRPAERRERQHEIAVPVAAGQVRVGAHEGVDRLPLVQLQQAVAVVLLDHPDVLVLGVGLEDHLALVARLDRPHGDREDRGGRDRRAGVAPAEPRGGDQREHQAERDEGPLGARERDQDQRGEHRPQQRPGRRDRVEPARDPAGVLDVRDGEADRPRRDRAQDRDRDRDQEEDREQRADERARLDLVERVDRELEERPGRRTGSAQEQRRAPPRTVRQSWRRSG